MQKHDLFNNVEATFDFVERVFRLEHSTMLLRHCCWCGRGLSVINGWQKLNIQSAMLTSRPRCCSWGASMTDNKALVLKIILFTSLVTIILTWPRFRDLSRRNWLAILHVWLKFLHSHCDVLTSIGIDIYMAAMRFSTSKINKRQLGTRRVATTMWNFLRMPLHAKKLGTAAVVCNVIVSWTISTRKHTYNNHSLYLF